MQFTPLVAAFLAAVVSSTSTTTDTTTVTTDLGTTVLSELVGTAVTPVTITNATHPTGTYGKPYWLFIPGFENEMLVASVITSDTATTTLACNCPKPSSGYPCDKRDSCDGGHWCPIPTGGLTVTYGPPDVQYEYTLGTTYTESWSCSVGPSTTTASCVVCSEGATVTPGTSTITWAGPFFPTGPCVFTAGVTNTITSSVPIETATQGSSGGESVIPIETGTSCSSDSMSLIPIGTAISSTASYYTATAPSGGSYSNSNNSTVSSSPTPTMTQFTGGLPQITGKAEMVVGAIAAGVAVLGIAL